MSVASMAVDQERDSPVEEDRILRPCSENRGSGPGLELVCKVHNQGMFVAGHCPVHGRKRRAQIDTG
jgi:hypothetical protein